jgi:putative SOS response-associated peptidase YedK
MCGRFILINTLEQIEKRFGLPAQRIEIIPNYNIGAGQLSPVITDDNPNQIQLFKFGLTPFWAKQEMFLFNARCEGDRNKADDPAYKGGKGIIEKPAFRKSIRTQRCLVIASAFIEGPKGIGLAKPYVVYLRDHQSPFAFAGIWDTWKNQESEEILQSFSIITTTANSLLQKIGHYRMPVILSHHEERKWLKQDAGLAEITVLLNKYDSELMNAYPIDPKLKNPNLNDRSLINPIGERLLPEEDFKVYQKIGYQGLGHSRRHKQAPNDVRTLGDQRNS